MAGLSGHFYLEVSPILIMQASRFIAQRLLPGQGAQNPFSGPVVRIAIIAVALSIGMMGITVATGRGLQQKIREKLAAFNGHIQIQAFTDNASEVSVQPIDTQQPFYPHPAPYFNSIDRIDAVVLKAGMLRTRDAFEGIVFKGLDRNYPFARLQPFLTAGRMPRFGATTSDEVLLSSTLASKLQLKPGQQVTAYFMKSQSEGYYARTFTIVGLYHSGIQEFDALHVLGDIRHAQRMNHWSPHQVGRFELFATDWDQLPQITADVYAKTGSWLDARSIADTYYFIFEWLKLFDLNIWMIIGIMLLVSTINMVVLLLVLILERTKMIGLLKALGMPHGQLRQLFLHLSLHILWRGLCWGNAIALLLLGIQWQWHLVQLPPENYYVTTAPVVFEPLWWIGLNVGTLLVCLLVLLIPARMIASISPAKVMHFE